MTEICVGKRTRGCHVEEWTSKGQEWAEESIEEMRAEGEGRRPLVDRCKPPLRDRINRTDNGLAVRGEGEGLKTGSKVRQPNMGGRFRVQF